MIWDRAVLLPLIGCERKHVQNTSYSKKVPDVPHAHLFLRNCGEFTRLPVHALRVQGEKIKLRFDWFRSLPGLVSRERARAREREQAREKPAV